MDQEFEILKRAEFAFARLDEAKREMHKAEAEVKALCTEYSQAMRIWGYRPEMLRMAVEARLGRKRAV